MAASPPRVNAREQAGDHAGAGAPARSAPNTSFYLFPPAGGSPRSRLIQLRRSNTAETGRCHSLHPPQAARGRGADSQEDGEAPSRRRKKTHRRRRLAPVSELTVTFGQPGIAAHLRKGRLTRCANRPSKLVFTPRQPSSNESSNAIGRALDI